MVTKGMTGKREAFERKKGEDGMRGRKWGGGRIARCIFMHADISGPI